MIGEMGVFQLWNVPPYRPVSGVVWCLSQRMWEKREAETIEWGPGERVEAAWM